MATLTKAQQTEIREILDIGTQAGQEDDWMRALECHEKVQTMLAGFLINYGG